MELLERYGASMPKESFDAVMKMPTHSLDEKAIDWTDQLRISEQAAIPSDTFFASADDLDLDQESRMPELSPEEKNSDYICFELSTQRMD